MGRDQILMLTLQYQKCFNPRARMGRDFGTISDFTDYLLFQPTRPHGARRGLPAYYASYIRFNPRARMGRDIYHLL